ncbi:MAG: hypothetical protein COB73_00430 [Flavobacteriaceae bacterium]|nr:MAG: hypothetical protein COB73_00430 [Flavobacteriaceae bacterium]
MKTKVIILFMLTSILSFGQKSKKQHVKGTLDKVNIEIEYSAPSVKGRTIFGELVPYAEVWRAGANANTTIEFSKNVTINGQALTAGKYAFFVIPNGDSQAWEIIFNKKNNAWGSFSYKESEDALRVKVKAIDNKEPVEVLKYEVTKNGIKFAWADKHFEFSVK